MFTPRTFMRTLNFASIAPVSGATLGSRIRAMTMSGLGLNLPNLISLARLLLVPLEIWLILAGRYGLAFWILVAAGISDALDGFIAKRFDRRTRLGALLDPVADKAMLIGVYITLAVAHQLWTSLVILVVLRDVMIVGGFLLIQIFAVAKHYDPLYVSKLNTGVQIILVGFVLARLGLGAPAGWPDLVLSLLVAVTTIVSGLSYVVRWARILARSEQAF
jgi:cardiolipin synthase